MIRARELLPRFLARTSARIRLGMFRNGEQTRCEQFFFVCCWQFRLPEL